MNHNQLHKELNESMNELKSVFTKNRSFITIYWVFLCNESSSSVSAKGGLVPATSERLYHRLKSRRGEGIIIIINNELIK